MKEAARRKWDFLVKSQRQPLLTFGVCPFITLFYMSNCIWLQFCCRECGQVHVGEFPKALLLLFCPGSTTKVNLNADRSQPHTFIYMLSMAFSLQLSSFDRDKMAWEAFNTYCPALYRKNLPIFMLEQCQILSLVNSGHPCFVSDFNGNASVVSFK